MCGLLRGGEYHYLYEPRTGDTFDNVVGYPIFAPPGELNFTAQFQASASGAFDTLRLPLYDFLDDPVNDLTISLIADSGNTPTGGILESFSLTSVSGAPALYTLTSALTPFLSAGSMYWVTLSAAGEDRLLWLLNSTGTTGVIAQNYTLAFGGVH